MLGCLRPRLQNHRCRHPDAIYPTSRWGIGCATTYQGAFLQPGIRDNFRNPLPSRGGCLPIVLLVPLRKLPQPFPQRDLRCKPEISFEGGSISIGRGDITRLHGHELLVGLEVVVRGEYAGADEFLLEDIDKLQQVLGLAAADVVDGIRRDGQAVLAGLLFRGFAHDPDDAFHDVIDIGEIPSAVAVVVDLDGLTFQQFVRESEIGHIWTPGRTVDGEEAEARGRDIVKLGIAVGEELVAFLGSRIQAHRIIHPVVHAERDFLVATVHAAGAGVDQVLDTLVSGIPGLGCPGNAVIRVPASLQDVVEPDHVALDVRIRVLDAITDTGLRRQVHDDIEVVFLEEAVDEGLVGEIALDELVGMLRGARRLLLDLAQTVLLERRIVVVVQVVKPDDAEGLLGIQEPQHEVGAYETGGAGDEEGLRIL